MITRPATLAFSIAISLKSADPIDIANRLELFTDSHLIESIQRDARRQLHQPIPREISLTMDKPWEGNTVNYVTAFRDGDIYRLYYLGADVVYKQDGYTESHREVTCYAESKDGIHWTRPNLGLFEFNGSKANAIAWSRHDFTPLRATNLAAPAGAASAISYGEETCR